MTTPLRPAILVAAAWAGLAGLQAQPPRPAVDEVVSRILEAAPATPISAWRARAPIATWDRYQTLLEDMETPSRTIEPGGFWCAVAMDRERGVERAAVFFSLRDTAPLDCRIELVQGVVRGTDADTAALYTAASDLMSKRLGMPASRVDVEKTSVPEPYSGATGNPDGIEQWIEAVRWELDDRIVVLYRGTGGLGFAMASREYIREATHLGAATFNPDAAESRLAGALRARFPDAARAMSYTFGPDHQDEIRTALEHLLDARRAAAGNDRPLLTFAVDRLARKLRIDPPEPSRHPELRPILQHGLRFTNYEHGEHWEYDGALVGVVLERWPETTWGQLAFVTRLYQGWSEGCSQAAYAEVIQHANRWLATHRHSPWRVTVMTMLATAYETKWAAGGFFTADPVANARLTDAESESARQSAIKSWEDVVRLAPASAEAAHARHHLIQLRINMTTGEDTYSCIIP